MLSECADLIRECKAHFADPAITEVEWKQKEKPVEVKLPSETRDPTIPDDLKGDIEWKKGTAKKPPVLKFKKALTKEIAEKAKALFQENNDVVTAIDEALSKQQYGSDDNDGDDQS